MTYGMLDALKEELHEAWTELQAAKVADGYSPLTGWPVPTSHEDYVASRKRSRRARKRVAGLYSDIEELEAASKEDE